jgi:ABC-type glycerol-3-phosphate transport system substrate-binding protein
MKLTGRFLVILVLVSLVLSSCQPVTTQAPKNTAVAQGAGEPVTIRIWDFGGNDFEWIDSIAIPKFNEKYPNIKIEHLGIPESDYSTKLDTAIAAKDVPDIALQSYTYKLWKAGHVKTLDEYMARDGINVDSFFPIFKSWAMLDGKTYVMPVNTYIWAMMYNKDLFAAAGLKELTSGSVITFDDWLTYARAINKPSEKIEERVFGSVIFTPNWNAMNNYMSEPYVLGPDAKNCKDNAATADWIQTWTDLATAYKEDLTVDSAGALIGQTSASDLFKQGKLGMIYATYGDALGMQKGGINVGLTGQPVVTPGWQGNVGSWMDGYGIMSASKHPDEAWEFIKFMTSEVAMMKANGDCAVCGNAPSLISQAEQWKGNDPLRQEAFALLNRVVPPPFSPDVWTAVDPFYEAFRLMTEENKDPTVTVQQAAEECQTKLDELWVTFDSLGQ